MEPAIKVRLAARLAVGTLALWAFASVLRTIFAIGDYEARIVVHTHGDVDVPLAWQAYELLEDLTSRRTAEVAGDRFWMFASLAAAVSFAVWLYQVRGTGRRMNWLASVLVVALVQGLVWLYDVVTARGGAMRGSWLDTRLVAYPLWLTATVTVLVTATVCIRLARQIANAQDSR